METIFMNPWSADQSGALFIAADKFCLSSGAEDIVKTKYKYVFLTKHKYVFYS